MPELTSYLTVQQVADIVHAEHRTVRRAIKSGELEAAMIGGKWLIRESAVEAWFESHRPGQGPQRRLPRPKAQPSAAAASAGRLKAIASDR